MGRPLGFAILPFLGLWFLAPGVAWWISLPLKERRPELSPNQVSQPANTRAQDLALLRSIRRAGGPLVAAGQLPEHPRPVVATRTSPTNIGMGLLCTLSAYDFGYLSLRQLTQRLAHTWTPWKSWSAIKAIFTTGMTRGRSSRCRRLYVSTVDNGNLAGLLLTLHSGLLEIGDQPWSASRLFSGLRDTVRPWLEQADVEREKSRRGWKRLKQD